MTRQRVDQTAFTIYEVHHSTSQAKKVDFEDNPDVGFTIMEYENIGGVYTGRLQSYNLIYTKSRFLIG